MKRNHSNSLEDITEFISEHKLELGMVVLGAIIAAQFFSGSGAKLTAKLDKDSQQSDVAEQQTTAEQIYKEQGCSAQFLNQATNKPGLTEGAIAIDPVTSAPFSGAYLCSPDGALWQVKQGGFVHFVGSSPNIRKALIDSGSVPATKEMQKAYSQSATPRFTGFPVNPN